MEKIKIKDKIIKVGDTLVLNTDSPQLGEQLAPEDNSPPPMKKGTELVIDSITKYPDGVHINFETEFGSVTIYQFALENMFNSNKKYFK